VRVRVWFALSVALNLVLAGVLWRLWPQPELTPSATTSFHSNTVATVIRTNTIIRRQNFLWGDLESDDYVTFIDNLRLIGCPEATIRDIIVADVNQLFTARQATDLLTPRQQWWRPQPDPEVVQAASVAALALEQERRDLLTQLLGPDWESADYPFPSAYALSTLDGALLGNLLPSTKAAVHEIERTEQARMKAYLDESAASGEDPDTAVLTQLQLESRQALAQVLSEAELEEYLLRYAPTAVQLRASLRGVDLSPDEFRTLFHTVDPIELGLAGLDAKEPDSVTQRESLEQQKDAALRETLGEERYETIRLSRDPLYQQARTVVTQAGVPEEQILPIAAIVRLTKEEERRIRDDLTLTAEARLEQLQATREAQRDSLRQLLGPIAYQRYLEMQPEVWENAQP
jgi:hypothetical protein